MIERFYLKDYLSFDEAELNLNNGLVVFTGPSGSGKSILMESILASVGGASRDASICENSVTCGRLMKSRLAFKMMSQMYLSISKKKSHAIL